MVDDGSTDNSLAEIKKHKNIILLKHPINSGRGAALKTALNKAIGDIIVFQDSDLEYDPKDIPNPIQPILDGHSRVVYGSRFYSKPKMPKSYYIGNKMLTIAINILYYTI